ncbi:MAG: TIGR03560 family F420-dependent LLM class oxidoreductase [bacterium]
MIEGQNGLNWPRWQRMARVVEDLGFAGLYRSDHFTNAAPPDLDSLELWVSLTWLAGNTSRIAFGPLVTPLSFRHPVMTARMAAAVDDLSGGRLTLGVGAAWQDREHQAFGFDLLPVGRRFDRFAEGVEVVSRLLRSDEPVSLDGKYFRLREAIVLPRPARHGGPPLLIGGSGPTRLLPLAARYADEWNATSRAFAEYGALTRRLDALLARRGRRPQDVRRSMMIGCVFGRTDAALSERLRGRSSAELRQRGVFVGTAASAAEDLRRFAGLGLDRVMLQWLDLDDLDGLEALAQAVLPHFH